MFTQKKKNWACSFPTVVSSGCGLYRESNECFSIVIWNRSANTLLDVKKKGKKHYLCWLLESMWVVWIVRCQLWIFYLSQGSYGPWKWVYRNRRVALQSTVKWHSKHHWSTSVLIYLNLCWAFYTNETNFLGNVKEDQKLHASLLISITFNHFIFYDL